MLQIVPYTIPLYATTNCTNIKMRSKYDEKQDLTTFFGDCIDLLLQIPDNSAQFVVTSPPYNIGKAYETKQTLPRYLTFQKHVINECYRILKPGGICGRLAITDISSIVPLDFVMYPLFDRLGMKMRNRIIWHFGHGLHASRRLSGRYDTTWIAVLEEEGYYSFADTVWSFHTALHVCETCGP